MAARRGPAGVLHHHSGYWKDTGNVADMLEVNRMVLEGMPRPAGAPSTPAAS